MCLLLTRPVLAQAPAKKAAEIKRLPTQLNALAVANADAKNLDDECCGHVLYVWNRDGDWEAVQALALVANYTSRSSAPCRLDQGVHPLNPLPGVYALAGGMVLRINLREFVESEHDLRAILLLREELRFDPSFSRFITKGTLELLAQDYEKAKLFFGGDIPLRKIHESKWTWDATAAGSWRDPKDGRVYRGAWKEEKIVRTVSVLELKEDVIRFNARHCDVELSQLQTRLQTEAPIVEGSYFVARLTSAIKGKALFRTLYGGLYADFIGLRRSAEKGVTDEDLLLQDLLVGGVVKVKAADIFAKQRSDRKLAMFKSKVTGSTREVEMIPVTTRGDGPSVAMITGDPSSEDADVDAHAIINLDQVKVKAREWLWKNSFGLDRAALTDAVKGTLQEKAPGDVVSDSEKPSLTKELDGGIISCGRCHSKSGNDGWQPMVNDVQRLFSSGLDVFGDLTDPYNRHVFDVAKRLRGKYQGNFNQTLKVLRDDNAAVVLRITGPWKKSKGQTDVFRLAWERISTLYADQMHADVDAVVALRRLGVDVPKEEAIKTFNLLVPKYKKGDSGLAVDDVRLQQIRLGGSIVANDWNLAYEGAMVRKEAEWDKLSKEKKP